MTIQDILTILSTGTVGFLSAIFAFKYDLIKVKATASTEVSKSDQEKITTADKTIDLVEKLRVTMDRQFEEMEKDRVIEKQKKDAQFNNFQKEIKELKDLLSLYVNQCSTCTNNKIK